MPQGKYLKNRLEELLSSCLAAVAAPRRFSLHSSFTLRASVLSLNKAMPEKVDGKI